MPPSRVFLLRHGQGEHNATGRDIRDPLLTKRGEEQASSWAARTPALDVDVVLISPLRRTIQTALLAFQRCGKAARGEGGQPQRLLLCRHARELWWNEDCNDISPEPELRKLLQSLPRGDELAAVEGCLGTPGTGSIREAVRVQSTTPETETASIRAMVAELRQREEDSVVVVCHWGVISDLCGADASNCALVECCFKESGRSALKVLKIHPSPGGGRTS